MRGNARGIFDQDIRDRMIDAGAILDENIDTEEKVRLKEGRNVLVGGAQGGVRIVNGKRVVTPAKQPVLAKVDGRGGMLDALQRLEMAKEQFGFEAFGAEGPEMERLYYALKNDLGDGQGVERDRGEAKQAAINDEKQRRMHVGDEAIASAGDRAVAAARMERDSVDKFEDELGREKNIRRAPITRFAPGVKADLPVLNPAAVGQAAIQEMVARRADGLAGGPEFRGIMNDAAAGAYVERKLAENDGIARQFAQQNLDAIPPIAQLGAAGPAAHGDLHEDNLRFGGVHAANNFGIADQIVENGKVIGHAAKENGKMVRLGEVNSVDSGNTLNAPKASPMMQWVAENQPAFGKNGVFGVPEADFNEAMALIGDRARGLQGLGLESMGNPRNLQEVEKVMGAIVGRGQKAKKQFFRFDKELGKNVAVSQPGVAEVMNMMRIPPAQQEMVAFALMQDALANAQDVNQADKQAFRGRVARPPGSNVFMNAPELRVDGGLPIDMIKNEKVGRGKNARGVRAGLAAINDNAVIQALKDRGELYTQGFIKDAKGNVRQGPVLLPEAARLIEGAAQARNAAQMPMQGAIRGEGVERARFVRGNARNMNTAEMEAKFGTKNARIAKEVMDRFDRSEAARQASPIDPGAELQRRMDARMQAEGKGAVLKGEDAEIGNLVQLMKHGRQFTGQDRFEMEGNDPIVNTAGEQLNLPHRVTGEPRGALLRVPNRAEFVGSSNPGAKPAFRKINFADNRRPAVEIPVGKPNFRRAVQPITEASTPASIAPQPGAGTGSQPAPMMDAGGGMQQPPRSTGASAPAPAPGGGGPMPSSMRNQLFSLPGPYQKKYMSEPEGPAPADNRVIKGMKEFANNPKYQRRRNIAYGAGGTVAGLATALGLSNISKEEEEVQV
jgi:hypothetical protein